MQKEITVRKISIDSQQNIVGQLVGEITFRAGQLSKKTEQFVIQIPDCLWRD